LPGRTLFTGVFMAVHSFYCLTCCRGGVMDQEKSEQPLQLLA